jgi:hypothetical protein
MQLGSGTYLQYPFFRQLSPLGRLGGELSPTSRDPEIPPFQPPQHPSFSQKPFIEPFPLLDDFADGSIMGWMNLNPEYNLVFFVNQSVSHSIVPSRIIRISRFHTIIDIDTARETAWLFHEDMFPITRS